jgi:hypothetical protein
MTYSIMAKAKFWPNLEDVFTNIDLAANTGHHLGHTNAPSDLRMTRRVLLARMFGCWTRGMPLPRSTQTEIGSEWTASSKGWTPKIALSSQSTGIP